MKIRLKDLEKVNKVTINDFSDYEPENHMTEADMAFGQALIV